MKRLIIFGCGGHARSVVAIVLNSSVYKYEDIILVDDNAKDNEVILGFSVVKFVDIKDDDDIFVAIGDNHAREQIIKQHKKQLITIVADSAVIAKDALIEKGVLVAEHAYIGPDVRIGVGSVINTGAVVEHEVVIGDYVHCAPHSTVCGRSKIGEYTFLGASATVIDYCNVGKNIVVGAGASVVNDLMEETVYVGVPAKKKV